MSFYSIILVICLTSSIVNGEICPHDVQESGTSICTLPNLPKTTHRMNTLRDLAWLLTPRTFFLTNANTFTYAAIHSALTSTCAPDMATLEKMQLQASYAFGDLTLSSHGGSRYLHLHCSPLSRGVHGVWSLLLSNLKRAPVSSLNWAGVEANIRNLAKKNPHIEDVVPDLGRIRCTPHPLCRGKDSPFCSAGVDPSALGESRWVMGWTDHISNTTTDGSALTFVGCINGKNGGNGRQGEGQEDQEDLGTPSPSWTTLSTVPQQGRDSIHDVWDMVKGHGFEQKNFAHQNYLAIVINITETSTVRPAY